MQSRMRIRVSGATIGLLLGVGLGVTAPQAKAYEPAMDGVYLYIDEDGGTGTWTVNTTCNPDCIAHVTTALRRGFDAPFVDGRYVNSRTIPDGLDCPLYQMADSLWDPGDHPVSVIQWWDPITLRGEVHFTPAEQVDYPHTPPSCYIVEHHQVFSLTKVSQELS